MTPLRLLVPALLMLAAACSRKPGLSDLKKMAATEMLPEDSFLNNAPGKKALVVVAHDDDDCAMSGTLALLRSRGWTVRKLVFVRHMDQEGMEVILDGAPYRYGLDTMKYPYVPIPKDAFAKQFPVEKIRDALRERINEYGPDAIFTLDNEMGGYGHPEHVFISQAVYDLFGDHQIGATRVYQSVFTDHMEKEIVDTWLANRMKGTSFPNPTAMAREMYQLDGMPPPTVQVTISSVGTEKMKYLRAYPEDVKKNLRKFIPYFESFDAGTYFSIFDREFFRVIQ